MSLFTRSVRPPAEASLEHVERYLAKLHAEIEPDPLYRRRLRSDVLNQFVAAREGIEGPGRPGLAQRRMGRVGRACLYASFSLGVSAASVLAGAQEALPGDALYGLKQRVEQLRIDVAPEHLHAELAVYVLGERIEEMTRLADSGRLEHALGMAPAIDREFRRLVALRGSVDGARAARIEHHLLVLEGLLERLPSSARAAVQHAIDAAPASGSAAGAPAGAGKAGSVRGPGATVGGGGPFVAEPVTQRDPRAGADRTPPRERPARPERTAKPEPTPAGESADPARLTRH